MKIFFIYVHIKVRIGDPGSCREENKLNELGGIHHRIKNLGATQTDIKWLPGGKLFDTFCEKDAIFNFLPHQDRGNISIVDLGMVNMHKAAKQIGQEDLEQTYLKQRINVSSGRLCHKKHWSADKTFENY